jgi:hypothetical protein
MARQYSWIVRGALVCATIVAPLVYAGVVHPRLLRWGATDAEIRGPGPGDELAPQDAARTARGITIDAPVRTVWPWILQVGQDRAGFYSYRLLENLVGAHMPDVGRIVPAFQHRAVGDTVRLASEARFHDLGRMIVAKLQDECAMILVMPGDAKRVAEGKFIRGGTWGFVLEACDANQSRLIMRSVDASHPTWFERALRAAIFDTSHFIMERAMMLNIKHLAETSDDRIARDDEIPCECTSGRLCNVGVRAIVC